MNLLSENLKKKKSVCWKKKKKNKKKNREIKQIKEQKKWKHVTEKKLENIKKT